MKYSPIALRRHSGFTLIELLTVIAVIALLASILVVGVDKVRNSAETAKCVSHLRQWDAALKLYVSDHNGKMPITKFSQQAKDEVWIQLSPYLSFEGVEDLKGKKLANMQRFIRKEASCPVEDWGYGFNVFLSEKPVAAIDMPARSIFAIDLVWPKRWLDATVMQGGASSDALATAETKPHNGHVNVLYMDGHVETKQVNQIMKGEITRESPNYDISDEDEPIASDS